ncbi:hypothetical protein ACWCXX_35600 [Streptomyces sp. NPDC001732]
MGGEWGKHADDVLVVHRCEDQHGRARVAVGAGMAQDLRGDGSGALRVGGAFQEDAARPVVQPCVGEQFKAAGPGRCRQSCAESFAVGLADVPAFGHRVHRGDGDREVVVMVCTGQGAGQI